MGLLVTLAGQDITDFVDESTIQVVSVLGQGAGVGSTGAAGQPSATFTTDLGPINAAIGAGQSRPATYKEVVLQDTPHGYWRMDSESTMLDVSGNAQNGTIVNGPLSLVTGSTGDKNPAWEPVGNAYIQLPLVLTSSNAVTLEALVFLTSNQAYGPVVGIGDWNTGYSFGIGNTDWTTPGVNLLARLGTTYKTPASPIALPVNQWVHIAVTFSSTAVTYYVNSVNSGTASMSGNAPTGHGYIGATSTGLMTANLLIDEVAAYASVLSASRISTHYGALGQGPVLVRQGEVTITDATGTKIFGGYVNQLDDASLPVTVKTALTCADYWQDLDRIEVNEVYAGQDDVYIIKDILTKYASWIDQSALPTSGTFPFDKRIIRATSVQQALQAIANATGFNIWISPDKVIHYEDPDATSTAPFTLSDNPDFVNSFGYDLTQYTQDDTGIINRVFFYGAPVESPDFTQDLSPQANGLNKIFLIAYYPHEATDGSIHVTKNGVDLVVGNPFSSGSDGKLKSAGGTADVLLNHDAKTLTFDVAPAISDTLTCTYRYNSPTVYVVSDQSSFQFFGRYFDGKLDDKNVLDATTAIQRCRVLLSEQSYGLVSLQVTTWQPGLVAGQIVKLTNELRALSDVSYIIQQVTISPLGSGYFEYQVQLGAWNWNLIDLLVATARRAGVQDTSTDENQTIIQAQETVEASSVALVTTLTTTTSGNYYSGNFYSGFATIIS